MRKTRREQALEDLRLAIGRAFGVAMGDVGAWAGDDRLWAGFYDGATRRPRSFAAWTDEAGHLTWREERPVGEAA